MSWQACHLKQSPNESPKIYADTSIIKPQDGKVSCEQDWSFSDCDRYYKHYEAKN